jgi:hypothetical protein
MDSIMARQALQRSWGFSSGGVGPAIGYHFFYKSLEGMETTDSFN